MLKKYNISGLIVSDGLAKLSDKIYAANISVPITLTVYVGLDRQGYETYDRRFIISGGKRNELFAVFNRDEFSFIRKSSNGRLVLIIHPPGNFWGTLFYSMQMPFSGDFTPEKFIEEMSPHKSVHAATRQPPIPLEPYL